MEGFFSEVIYYGWLFFISMGFIISCIECFRKADSSEVMVPLVLMILFGILINSALDVVP